MTTEEFTNKLKEYDCIDEFMLENANRFEEDAFNQFVGDMLDRKGITIAKLANDTGISVPYAYDLFKGRKTSPKKDMLIRLAFGLNLSLGETNRLLTLGGVSELRSKVRRESIIIFCINKGYSILETDDILDQYNLQSIR